MVPEIVEQVSKYKKRKVSPNEDSAQCISDARL